MLLEIRQLQHKNKNMERRHKALLQKQKGVEQIIEALTDERRCAVVMDRLRRVDNPRSIAQWLRRSTMNTSKALSPASDVDLTAAVEIHQNPVYQQADGQPSPGSTPTFAQELMDEWQRACCPGMHSMNMEGDRPSVGDDTLRQKSMSISSLLNSD